MKHCNSCKRELNENEFNFKSIEKNIKDSKCRTCRKLYYKSYYNKNSKVLIKKSYHDNIKALNRNRKYVFNYLKSHPCVDCNENDPIVLEFDHLNDKIDSISVLVNNRASLKKIQKEIDKCEVRCANCHRKKTAKQNNYYTYLYSIN